MGVEVEVEDDERPDLEMEVDAEDEHPNLEMGVEVKVEDEVALRLWQLVQAEGGSLLVPLGEIYKQVPSSKYRK